MCPGPFFDKSKGIIEPWVAELKEVHVQTQFYGGGDDAVSFSFVQGLLTY